MVLSHIKCSLKQSTHSISLFIIHYYICHDECLAIFSGQYASIFSFIYLLRSFSTPTSLVLNFSTKHGIFIFASKKKKNKLNIRIIHVLYECHVYYHFGSFPDNILGYGICFPIRNFVIIFPYNLFRKQNQFQMHRTSSIFSIFLFLLFPLFLSLFLFFTLFLSLYVLQLKFIPLSKNSLTFILITINVSDGKYILLNYPNMKSEFGKIFRPHCGNEPLST